MEISTSKDARGVSKTPVAADLQDAVVRPDSGGIIRDGGAVINGGGKVIDGGAIVTPDEAPVDDPVSETFWRLVHDGKRVISVFLSDGITQTGNQMFCATTRHEIDDKIAELGLVVDENSDVENE